MKNNLSIVLVGKAREKEGLLTVVLYDTNYQLMCNFVKPIPFGNVCLKYKSVLIYISFD